MRVIIAGGRDFQDYGLLQTKCNNILKNIKGRITILCGKAKGADTLGEWYAKANMYDISYYPANWNKLGKAAGYIRNKEMAENADCLIAFWDGVSKGTKHMIDLAKEKGLKIRIIRY